MNFIVPKDRQVQWLNVCYDVCFVSGSICVVGEFYAHGPIWKFVRKNKLWCPDNMQSTLWRYLWPEMNENIFDCFEWHMSIERTLAFSRQINVYPLTASKQGIDFVETKTSRLCYMRVQSLKCSCYLSKQFNRHQCMANDLNRIKYSWLSLTWVWLL